MRLATGARRAGALAALAGLGLLGFAAGAPAVPAATSAPAAGTVPAAATVPAGTTLPARAPVPARTTPVAAAAPGYRPARKAPAVPASAHFVAAPRVARRAAGIRQVCPTPVRPGQMTCMALAPARAGGAIAAAAQPPPQAYSPAVLQEAYGLTSAAAQVPASAETVAIVDAYNDPDAGSDLSAYRAQYGLGACTVAGGCLKIVNQLGNASPLPKADSSGAWELEESLDLDMVSATCPQCHILLIEAKSSSITDLATAERYATLKANVVSNSWGSGAEFTGERVFDAQFYRPGVAITVAAGDAGYGTQYPAAVPFVTAVGGTSLQRATTSSPGSQSAWSGSGAGCSVLEPRPSWQNAPAGCLNRTANDVSADADPDPGVAVYDSASYHGEPLGWTALGGTSAATAIIASTYALADIAAGGPGDGLIPGTFPAAYPYQAHGGLTDVTAGSDGTCEPARRYLCRAGAGYDGPTGLGTPRGTTAFTGPTAGAVTVVNPGTQVLAAGAPAALAVQFVDTSDAPDPVFTMTGLPPGLQYFDTGAISGSPAKPGSYRVTVTVTDAGIGSGTATFTIVVLPKLADAHPGTGAIRLSGHDACLAAAARGSRRTGAIVISRCTRGTDQHWEYVTGSSPWSAGTLRSGGRCLSITAASGAGARAALRSCHGSPGQQWLARAGGQLANPRTGRCLDDPGGSTRVGRQVVAAACGAAGGTWQLPPGPILAGVSGRCLADPGDSAAAGTRAEINRCGASAAQMWTAGGNGSLLIRGRCLGVRGASRLDGAAVVLGRCGRSAAQQWRRGPGGELVNGNSGRCLADPGNAAVSGTKLTQADCYGEPGEAWLIS